jgi:hypothetical protein
MLQSTIVFHKSVWAEATFNASLLAFLVFLVVAVVSTGLSASLVHLVVVALEI